MITTRYLLLAKINPATELVIRLLILDELNISNQIFRETFREFDIEDIAKTSRVSEIRPTRPIILPGAHVLKRSYAHA